MPLHHETQAEFYGTRSSITGTAVYDFALAYDYSADIGGRDGWCVDHCTMLRVECDDLHLTRDQIENYIGPDAMRVNEQHMAEQLQQMADAGDFAPDMAAE